MMYSQSVEPSSCQVGIINVTGFVNNNNNNIKRTVDLPDIPGPCLGAPETHIYTS